MNYNYLLHMFHRLWWSRDTHMAISWPQSTFGVGQKTIVLNHDDVKLHGIIPVWVAQKLHVTEGAGAEGLTPEYQCLGAGGGGIPFELWKWGVKALNVFILCLGGAGYSCVEIEGWRTGRKVKVYRLETFGRSQSEMAVFKDCKVNIEMYPRDKADEGRAIHSWVETEFTSAWGSA